MRASAYLTLNLLTWTKWWAPASASKWQIGFNSAFKGLMDISLPALFFDPSSTFLILQAEIPGVRFVHS
jgi:hypothetical protein